MGAFMKDDFTALEEKIDLGSTLTDDDLRRQLKGAIQGRSALTYFVWKVLGEQFGEQQATELLAEAYRRYGRHYGEQWGTVHNAAEALLAQTSKGGYLTFDQEFTACTPAYAQKDFHACPHMEMFRALGATPEEMKTLCQDVLSEGDYANLDSHPGVTLTFKKQIGAGDNHCEYCLTAAAPQE